MQPLSLTSNPPAVPEFLIGGGEMGQRIREYDWTQTPLGPIETWPQSLRTCIRIMLTSRQPIWIGWGKELIKFYNDPYQAIVGGKHPWALGKPASVVWKDIWRDIEPMLKQVMEKDQGTYVESQLLIMERNGYPEETYYTFSYTPIPGDDGRTAGMFCANTDDTEKIISERQLKTLTNLGKRLADSQSAEDVIRRTIATLSENPQDFPFAFFRTISEGKAILAHSTPLGEAENTIPAEVDLKSDHPIALALNMAIETGRMQLFDHLIAKVGLMPAGAWQVPTDQALVIPIVSTAQPEPYGILIMGKNPFRLLDEKYSGFFSLIADQIATAFSDVHVLEVERQRAEALAEIDRAKTTFFSNISHEFRTPLTLLLGPIEDVLSDPEIKAEHKLRMEVAYRNTLRMQKLVNTLLDFSRIEAGRLEGRFSKVDLCTLTKDLASTFRSAIEKAGMSLVFDCGPIKNEVYVDVDMWEKIVLNLVSNAFKYSREGAITVALNENGSQVQLSVSDNGIGIPDDQLEKVFDRFHRIETSQGRSQEGTGIGLAMVKELVKLHGGSIEVKSVLGQGSTFLVTIPTGKDHLIKEHLRDGPSENRSATNRRAFEHEALKWTKRDAEASPPPAADRTITNHPQTQAVKKPVVLLADDNADMRDYVARLLADDFTVVTAADGSDAYQKLLLHRPDLVLSDVMMPGLDGFGLLKKLRSDPQTRETPVIFLSARAGEEAKIEGFEKGADDYLVKPFSAKELLARVTAQISLAKKRGEALQTVLRLFDEVPFAVAALKGKDLIIDYINQYNLDVFECAREDVLHKPLFEACPEMRAGAAAIHEEVYRTGKRFQATEIGLPFFKDGIETIRYFNTIIDPLFDEGGEIIGQLATSIEVTEEVLARRKAEESDQQLRFAIEAAELGTWDLNPATNRFHANDRTREWFGLKQEEEIDLDTALAVIADKDRAQVMEAMQRALQSSSGGSFDIIYSIIHPKTKQEKIIRARGKASFNAEGRPYRLNGTLQDVTEEVIARRTLQENEERLRVLSGQLELKVKERTAELAQVNRTLLIQNETFKQAEESSGQGSYSFNLTTGLLTYSDNLYRLLGYSAGEFRPALDEFNRHVHPDDRAYVTQSAERVLNTEMPDDWRYRMIKKGGEIIHIRGTGRIIRSGKEVLLVGTLQDVTTDVLLKQSLQSKNRELERSNEDLLQFAHVASHDLKEPLRKIRTFASRLRSEYEEYLPEKARSYLNKMDVSFGRMFAMIEGVLLYSSVEAHEIEKEPVDLNQVIEAIQSDLEVIIQQKEAEVISEDLPVVSGAPVLLHQLFYNLINNALKFINGETKPVIRIEAKTVSADALSKQSALPSNQRYVHITVKDNGIGFRQQDAEKIFRTFTRLNSKDQYEGTGLGLALCKKIVERHNGVIAADSEVGKGARFTIILPAADTV